MPGAPHFGRSIPITERSTQNIVIMFFAFPVLSGLALVCWTIVSAIASFPELTDWTWIWQVAFGCILGLLIMTALPAVGWQELRRRQKEKEVSVRTQT